MIRFTKAHGAKNDFLMSWAADVPEGWHREIAIAICDRHTGIGGDGWYLVTPPTRERPAAIKLYNSDGSSAELSGNGTRCVAAFLRKNNLASHSIEILTGAGSKELQVIQEDGCRFELEMGMGQAQILDQDVYVDLVLKPGVTLDVAILDVGNPQCAVFVNRFPGDWRQLGATIECHPRFSNRTNVSFVRVIDEHTLDVRFFERGAGETMSSGTGSTGAAAAAMARGLVESPVEVLTPAGPLHIRWDGPPEAQHLFLAGPAEIVGSGEFYWRGL